MLKLSPHAFTACIVACLSFVLTALPVYAEDKPPVLVGFDGAYAVKNSTSAQAIELGLRAGIHEINANGGVLDGRPLKLVVRDNRSVAARGIANMEEFAAMPDMVAVFGGRFSPVILQQLEITHKEKMLLLNVWGAADGITDHDFTPNYAFRLSLKDSWAMPVMLNTAKAKGANSIGLLLPNTGWGRSNQKALNTAMLSNPDMNLVSTLWYNWGEQDMLKHYNQMIGAGAQAILLVANDLEASLLVRQLGDSPASPRVPIVSHWGVTGGNMVEASGPTLAELDFSIVQTFSFLNARPGPLAKFSATVKALDGVDDVTKLESPVGVGHAYDMIHILAKAITAAGTTDREKIRAALEGPIVFDGLVSHYDPAFSASSHDALTPQNVFMTKYRSDGILVPLNN